ncbi:uncharacterized protein [Nicotiana sylvestris]|uniref:uncharacterized protein n=1 Tax=Nicotiana sylvestris TaxID=4096 RepID=UPI00388CA498
MSEPWPVVAWGMDVIGPIEPATSNGHRFILVAIDYFTKWVEAKTFKSMTKMAVVDFVHSNIICRFGIPKFKITHRNSTPYRPKANGAAEAANKNIKKILRKMVQGSRQWHEKLPFALLGYRTTVRTLVGATPYLLVYDTEAVIPTEVEISSLWIVVEAEIDDDEWVKTCLEQLSLIDEKISAAVRHGQLFQKRMARAYNKKGAENFVCFGETLHEESKLPPGEQGKTTRVSRIELVQVQAIRHPPGETREDSSKEKQSQEEFFC